MKVIVTYGLKGFLKGTFQGIRRLALRGSFREFFTESFKESFKKSFKIPEINIEGNTDIFGQAYPPASQGQKPLRIPAFPAFSAFVRIYGEGPGDRFRESWKSWNVQRFLSL